MKYLPILSVFFVAAVCNPKPPAPPTPVPSTDAGPAPTPTPAPVPTPVPPPTPGDAYDAACANLKALGCSSGMVTNCASSMRLADQQAVTRKPIATTCITTAKTVTAAKACGFVVCR